MVDTDIGKVGSVRESLWRNTLIFGDWCYFKHNVARPSTKIHYVSSENPTQL